MSLSVSPLPCIVAWYMCGLINFGFILQKIRYQVATDRPVPLLLCKNNYNMYVKQTAFSYILTQIDDGIHSAVSDAQQRYADIRLPGAAPDEEGTNVEHGPDQEVNQGNDQELDGQSGLLGFFLGLLGGTRCPSDGLSGFPEFH